MPIGNIQLTAKTARDLDVLIDYVQQLMGAAVDLEAPRLYRAGQHIAFGQIMMEAATLELPPQPPASAGQGGNEEHC